MPPKQLRFNPTVDEYEERQISNPPKAIHSPTSAPVLYRTLRPGECPGLDFSLPSYIFRADPALDLATLNRPASNPPLTCITVRIPSPASIGLCRFEVLHSPRGQAVTVGDVLSAIREHLRQPFASSDSTVHDYYARRVQTVGNYCGNVDERTRRKNKDTEGEPGIRRVDHLQGKVLFAGIEVRDTSDGPIWHMKLEESPRYTGVCTRT
ncbi:hypothetical protein FB451DRAFT_1570413 [Mycena latifolia]|nr:hypothetical protein FB451DRAFT_1570413 [Mycena latifolia]